MNTLARADEKASGRPSASKTRLRLWLRILSVSRLIEGELRERLRESCDTTLPRFDVLAALHRSGDGLKMSALSGVLRVSNGNVTGIVDRLAADGLVVRLPVAGDRRAMLVRLTPKGAEDFARFAAAHEAWLNEMLGSVTVAEANQLIAGLQSVRDRLAQKEAMQ
jgi:DNA-binding MarR family transcriptional regulator